MNRKRLGQYLIAGVFTACAAAVISLIELVTAETEKQKAKAQAEAEQKAES